MPTPITPEQFVTWLQGFVAGSNNYSLTPSGWQELKDKLAQVEINTPLTVSQFQLLLKREALDVPAEDRVQLMHLHDEGKLELPKLPTRDVHCKFCDAPLSRAGWFGLGELRCKTPCAQRPIKQKPKYT